jgi:hypothetical protein
MPGELRLEHGRGRGLLDVVAERLQQPRRPGDRGAALRINGSPRMRALITSSTPAASRTVRVTAPLIAPPAQASPVSGPQLTRPRVGLSPTSPHSLAGMRMESPPSVPCATGTRPAATVAIRNCSAR